LEEKRQKTTVDQNRSIRTQWMKKVLGQDTQKLVYGEVFDQQDVQRCTQNVGLGDPKLSLCHLSMQRRKTLLVVCIMHGANTNDSSTKSHVLCSILCGLDSFRTKPLSLTMFIGQNVASIIALFETSYWMDSVLTHV
jgi:hypothetical protein